MKAILLHIPGLPWECLARDDAALLLPTFHRLIESGSAGPLPAAGQHPLMDGVILTGREPGDSGLLTAMAPRADGFGADLTGAPHLETPGFARHLDRAGARCALVNLRGTHFDELDSGIVASDAFFEIRAHSYGEWGIPPGALAPLGMADQLADLRIHPEDLQPSQLGPLLAGERDPSRPEQLRTLAKALAETSGAHAVATCLAERGGIDLCAVRYPVLTQLDDVFADPVKCATGKGTAWQSIALLDAFVARIIALSGNGAVIMITGGTSERPFWIASGPGVEADQLWPLHTTLYDVAPSLLSLFGLRDPAMPGTHRIAIDDAALTPVTPVPKPVQVLSLPEGFGPLPATEPSRAQRESLARLSATRDKAARTRAASAP